MNVNCLGQEWVTACGIYTGPDVAALNIRSGDNLDAVLLKIIAGATNTTSQPVTENLNTDNITSKSIIRNIGSVSASKIIKRDFTYKVTTGSNGTTVFNWDLIPVIHQLPAGYEAALTKVKISGKPTTGTNVIADSKSPGANLTIPLDRYPVTVDLTIRVTSPTGNIDLQKTVDLINPSITGSYRAVLDALDLNPQSGEMSLTEHLNSIESQVRNLAIKQDSTPDISGDVVENKLALEAVQATINTPSSLIVEYSRDGVTKTGDVRTVISDLFTQVKSLTDKNISQQSELKNLRSQIDSI